VETKVEIQIRTIAMDFWASLEHKIYYKFEGNAPEHIRKELKECSDIVAYLDQKMLSLNEEIKGCSRAQISEYHQEITSTYRAVVAESFGTIIEEDEEETGVKAEAAVTAENVSSSGKDKSPSGEAAEDAGKQGRKRMIFGFRV
jgi:putative GTP pyrophosphokinase